MIAPSPRSHETLGTIISIFIACATTFAVGVVFALQHRPPHWTDMVAYSVVAFVASGGYTKLRLRRLPEESFVGRTVMIGIGGGVVTLVAITLTHAVIRWSVDADFAFMLFMAVLFGAIIGAVGGLMMLLVVAYALERTLYDRLDRLLFSLSLIVALLATILALGQAGRGSYGGFDGAALMVLAAVGLVISIVRDVRRTRWLAKLPPNWSIAPLESPADDGLPSLVLEGGEVLVLHAGTSAGPFRGTTTEERVARFDRVLVPKILRRRIVLAGAAIALMVAFTPRLVKKRLAVQRHEHREASHHPTVVEGLRGTTTQIVVATDYACAVTDEKLRCWGNDAGDRLKLGSGPQWTAAEYAGAAKVERVVAWSDGLCTFPGGRCTESEAIVPDGPFVHRDKFSLGVTNAGYVWWAGDRSSLLPRDATEHERTATEVEIAGLRNIRQVAASDGHACAIDASGDVHCWGVNRHGCVDGQWTSDEAVLRPTKVAGLPKIDRVVLGPGASWARSGTRWYSWGGDNGAVTDGSKKDSTLTELPPQPVLRDVVATHSYRCFLYEDGAVNCEPYQWGEGSNVKTHMDSLPPGDTVEIAGSDEQLCARGAQVRCWGPHRP